MRRARSSDPMPARCTCRHLVTTHAINGKGQRVKCSASGCGCMVFVSAKVAKAGGS